MKESLPGCFDMTNFCGKPCLKKVLKYTLYLALSHDLIANENRGWSIIPLPKQMSKHSVFNNHNSSLYTA